MPRKFIEEKDIDEEEIILNLDEQIDLEPYDEEIDFKEREFEEEGDED